MGDEVARNSSRDANEGPCQRKSLIRLTAFDINSLHPERIS